MKCKLLLLIIPIVFILSLTACDSGGNSQCTEITNVNNFMLAFAGCPNDTIKAVCNSFFCTLTDQTIGVPLPVPIVLNPKDYSRIDRCVNLECDLNDPNMLTGQALFSILEILTGNSLIGVANLGGQDNFDFQCDIILP